MKIKVKLILNLNREIRRKKNMISEKQKFNKISLQKQNKNIIKF